MITQEEETRKALSLIRALFAAAGDALIEQVDTERLRRNSVDPLQRLDLNINAALWEERACVYIAAVRLVCREYGLSFENVLLTIGPTRVRAYINSLEYQSRPR